jgi:hypothetical protein
MKATVKRHGRQDDDLDGDPTNLGIQNILTGKE